MYKRVHILTFLALVSCSSSSDGPFEAGTDGLPVSTPLLQGMDEAKMTNVRRLASELPELTSLLIIRNGNIVSEQYFLGNDRSTAFNIKSASKSILSALTGIALRERFISGMEQKVADYFPEYRGLQGEYPKNQITIRHLLTMTSGLKWDENGAVTQAWLASSDWIRFIFDLPMTSQPGEVFNYTTACAHLLSALLARASKMSTLDFANKYLFQQTGIAISRWDRDPQGNYFGGAEMYITARNLGKFGILYLNDGIAGGKQVVPADWVHESTKVQVRLGNEIQDQGYGYMWWIKKFKDVDCFYASGAGGQFLFCIPVLNLVVVTNSSLVNSSDSGRIWEHFLLMFKLLETHILPAVIR